MDSSTSAERHTVTVEARRLNFPASNVEDAMARILDYQLIELLQVLPDGLKLASYQRSPHGWTAELHFKNREFLCTSQFGYIDVAELVAGKKRKKAIAIEPPEDQRIDITTVQVCELLTNATR